MSYADEIRQKITSDLRARAREYDAGGLPFVAAVCRETADNIDRAVARATAEGLRRIGVAVAVWAGMAAAYRRGVVEAGRAQRMHGVALDLANTLDAERAARRKWELRLRARAHAAGYCFDRLAIRAFNVGYKSPSCPVLALIGSGVSGVCPWCVRAEVGR